MLIHDILWIEDDTKFVEGILKNFDVDSVDLGYKINPFHYVSLQDFENEAGLELSALALKLVCVDYNLPNVNGDEIIEKIRSFEANKTIRIVFYSYAKNEKELREILLERLPNLDNIHFIHKSELEDAIIAHLK
ncbi:hypothetical protein [Pedobacter sp.]|uniref:hypothetical protein n=1 Tax=Pedobacter sp. TaxID=1411316 RepID=UPI0031D411AC